jgi:hypothetical protein
MSLESINNTLSDTFGVWEDVVVEEQLRHEKNKNTYIYFLVFCRDCRMFLWDSPYWGCDATRIDEIINP